MDVRGLELYYADWCPYCRKVLRFMDANGISLEMHDVDERGNRAHLIDIGGSSQVPCLVIEGKAMYESDDIIAYLADRLSRC